MFNTNIKSILHLIQTFPTEQSCLEYLEQMRWGGEVISPFDETSKVYKCKGNKYRCKNTGKYFTAKTGTMYDGTKIPLQKWFIAVWLVTAHKRGISSLQLGRDIDVSQKTAWFILQRVRSCLGVENESELDGTVEIDETFVGGKNKNRHKDKKVQNSQGRSFKDKTPVLGMLQRAETGFIERPNKLFPDKVVKEKVTYKSSRIRCEVVENTKKDSIQPHVLATVKEGSNIMTDEWLAYRGLGSVYNHGIVDHSRKEYVNLNDSSIYSNNVEGAWKIFKGAVSGTYNHVSPKHLQLYADEFVYRFNMKQLPDSDKFNWAMLHSGVRTKYRDLVRCKD